MSPGSPSNLSRGEMKLLPGAGASSPEHALAPAVVAGMSPTRQLSELPKDELEALAEEFGLDPTRYKTRQLLVAALHDRRQMIASMDREAMLDVVRWGRRPVPVNASREQLAQEIARVRKMDFAGLSHRGLVVLAKMRGIPDAGEGDGVPRLVRRLKKKEGFFSRVNRKRRSMIASLVAGMVGEEESSGQYQFLPPASPGGGSASTSVGAGVGTSSREPSIKEEIEESGLIGGITSRIRKTADSYVNQKLDEIEARIDRKLDEIDRRLAEWRDKEIANRIRILKITLWASVIVGIFSLLYSYVSVYFAPAGKAPPPKERPAAQQVDK
jgi:hypothetical protein